MNETARNSCVTLAACAGALLSAVIPAHPQTDGTSVDQAVLQAVALLVHALYDDEPYEFIYTSSETAIVQETGRSSLRFVVRPVVGSSCLFRATSEQRSCLNIVQPDFAKFGGHQIVKACGQKGTVFESSCSAGLVFKQQAGSFCQYIFNSGNVSLENLTFPEEACRYLAYGNRREDDIPKYVAAFNSVYKRCATSIDPKAKPPERQPDK
jgi:hypothetical protein